MNIGHELLNGNIIGVIKKLWFMLFGHEMPEELAELAAKFSTDQGKVVWAGGATVVSEIKAGKSFDEAVSDGWDQIKHEAPDMAIKDLADAAGIQKRRTE